MLPICLACSFDHSFLTGFHLSARKVREKINLYWDKLHCVKYLQCIPPFVITSLCFSRAISNVFCYKYVLTGFLCVYAKIETGIQIVFSVSFSAFDESLCAERSPIFRNSYIQDRYPSLPLWIWLTASKSSCKMRALFPHSAGSWIWIWVLGPWALTFPCIWSGSNSFLWIFKDCLKIYLYFPP